MKELHNAKEPAMQAADGSRVWLPELVQRFGSFIGGNEFPCSLRLVNKATAVQSRGRPEYTTVRLSQPVPHRAFAQHWGAPGATRSLTLSQRQQLVCLTAASGSTANLEVAIAAVGGPLVARKSSMLASAARAGKVKVCRWLLRHGYGLAEVGTAAEAAARGGQQEAVEFLLAKWADWNWDLVCAAARGGLPALVDWLLLRRPKGPLGPDDSLRGLRYDEGPHLFIAFAEGCSLAELQAVHRRVHTSRPPGWAMWYAQALEAAARSPTADWRAKVEWLEAVEPAARQVVLDIPDVADWRPDALDRLSWLRQRGHRLGVRIPEQAAKAGSAAALAYLLAEGIEVDVIGCAGAAAAEGRLEVLLLLHARGCLSSLIAARVARRAAEFGQLSVLVWAEKELGLDLPSIPGLVTVAAGSGSVELLAWLHERGCGWDGGTFAAAAGSGCEAALEWLAERGCPMGEDGGPYLVACDGGPDLPVLRCLQRLGCSWGPVGSVFNRFLQKRYSLSTLRWLVEAGCPVDWKAAVATAARARNRPEVLSWLLVQQQQQQ